MVLNANGPGTDNGFVDPERGLPATGQSPTDAALRRVLDAAGIPAATIDLEGRLTAANPAFARACGRAVGELVGLHLLSLCPGRDQAELLGAIVHLVSGGSRIERGELGVVSGEGSVRELLLTLGTAVDEAGRPVAIHAVAEDITARRREERRREGRPPAEAEIDLAAVPTPDADVPAPVASALAAASRSASADEPFALLLCEPLLRDAPTPTDGDGSVAPWAVEALAERLRQRLRSYDTVCPPDDHGIAVVAERLGDVQDAAGVAYRLLAAVVEPLRSVAQGAGEELVELPIDLVVGIAVGDRTSEVDELWSAARTALDAARSDGVGSFRIEDRRTAS